MRRHQRVPIERLRDWPALVATVRMLDDEHAPPDEGIEVPPLAQVVDQLGLAEEPRQALLRMLNDPGGPTQLRDLLPTPSMAALSPASSEPVPLEAVRHVEDFDPWTLRLAREDEIERFARLSQAVAILTDVNRVTVRQRF